MKRELKFENLFIYEGNRIAYLAAKRVVEAPGELFNPLYVYGGSGIGKTHLLWAIFSELNRKSTALFFSAKEFERYLDEADVQDVSMVVDDLHLVSPKHHKTLASIIDSLVTRNKQVCFSGAAAPRALQNFDAMLVGRLEGGLVCDIQPPKEIALVDMIKKKAADAKMLLPDEVAVELAQISDGSIRIIEGMLNRLSAYSSLGNVTLDINSVHSILKEFYPKGVYTPVSSMLEELRKDARDYLKDVSEKPDLLEEYKEKIYVWEMKGFDTSSLKPFLDGDVEILKKEYDSFIKKIQKIIELQKEIGSVNLRKFPDEAIKLESMMFSPDRVADIERLINDIKSRAEPDEMEGLLETTEKEVADIQPEIVPEPAAEGGKEVTPLGLPGESPEKKEVKEVREVTPTPSEAETQRVAETEVPKLSRREIKEERFLLPEITGELIEENL